MYQQSQLNLDLATLYPRVTNISSVPQRSPFRYAGGKTWLIPQIRQWLSVVGGQHKTLLEPFAGGGITGLTAAFENWVDRVIMVEKDEGVAAVWQVILEGGAHWLSQTILDFHLTPQTATAAIAAANQSLESLALATIIKNRVNRGGILAHGAGFLKKGENGKGITSRWYPETLSKRILAIDQIKDKIKFVKGDGLTVCQEYLSCRNMIYFIDPPYLKAARRLYHHSTINHEFLFQLVDQLEGEILMSYDNVTEVKQLAENHGFLTVPIAMKNTHHAQKTELLISRNFQWFS